MEKIMCFALLLGVLVYTYNKGRNVERAGNWCRLRDTAQELYELTKRCEEQEKSGNQAECSPEWIDGAFWALRKWREGSL